MGMSDRQFDSYKRRILRELQEIKEEIEEKGVTVKKLNNLIQDLDDELQRP